ncbi:ribonucleoprotein RB97D-like [Planococcus citri]|uniref:ribonucleoprotein RB97D-like n=1 Tax=Planococcus citri TaxID=170843 RepID=UPI0031F83BAB
MEQSKYRIFVCNLNPITSDNEFVSYFQSKCGGVEEGSRIIRDSNGRSKGYGYVNLAHLMHVNQVLSEKCHIINGSRVVCKISSPRKKNENVINHNKTPKHLRTIYYIGNLDPNTTLRQMKDYFSYFGAMEHAYIVSDENNRSLGYGFVEFQKVSAVNSVQELRPHIIHDNAITTSRCYPRDASIHLKKPSTVLYVSNYKYIDEDDIEEYFTQFGDIAFVSRKVKYPQDTKFMEIHFVDYDAVDVICLAGNHTINDQTITVSKYWGNNLATSSQKIQTGVQSQAHPSTSNAPQNSGYIHQHANNAHFVNQQQPSYQSRQQHDHYSQHQRGPERNDEDCVIL